MPNVDINLLAVLVAALINMAVGMVWYSKDVFGREWAKVSGRKLEDMSGGGMGYGVATVAAIIQSFILAHFVQYAGAGTFWRGLVAGFWLWVGFVATVTAVNLVFEGRSWTLWKINAGYFLVVLLINGGLLAAWR